jgi:Spy/CpxP family protein refolding chaperone
MRTHVAWIVGVTVLSLSVAAVAQERGAPGGGMPRDMHRGGGGREGVLKKMLRDPDVIAEAGITEEQVETLRKAGFALEKREMAKREMALRAELETAGLEQARLMTEAEVDKAAVMTAVEDTGRIRTELAKLKVEQLLTVKETLTDEQLKALRQIGRRQARERGVGERHHDMTRRHRDRRHRGGEPEPDAPREEMEP